MEITLEKIELVTDRTGSSYKDAKEALEQSEGNVVDAIIYIEEKFDEKKRFFFKGDKSKKEDEEKEAIIAKLKVFVEKGNVSRIVFKKDGEVFLNIPVNAGAIGLLLAPWAALAGTAAALITKCTIEIIKDDGEIVDFTELANEKMDVVSKKADEVYQDVKVKAEDAFGTAKDKAEDHVDDVKEKAGDTIEKVVEKTAEKVEEVKEKIKPSSK